MKKKFFKALLLFGIIALFSGCNLGFKNELNWNESEDYKNILGSWKKKNKIFSFKDNDGLKVVFSEKNKKDVICSAKLFEQKSTQIVQMDMSSCLDGEKNKTTIYKYLFIKVGKIDKKQLDILQLDSKILGKIAMQKQEQLNIKKSIIEMCKEEDKKRKVKREGDKISLDSKYSSFESCIALNLTQKDLSSLIKEHHNKIFIEKESYPVFRGSEK